MDDRDRTNDQLMETARRIFHGEPPGPLLVDIPDHQVPALTVMLDGMEERRRQFIDGLDTEVAEHGHIIIGVLPSDDSPSFAYTVGLADTCGAELIVRGFGDATGAAAEGVARMAKNGDIRLEPGDYQIDEAGAIWVVDWTGDPSDFGAAHRYHKGDDFRMVHVIISDDQGRFPGDEGCTVAEFQMMGL